MILHRRSRGKTGSHNAIVIYAGEKDDQLGADCPFIVRCHREPLVTGHSCSMNPTWSLDNDRICESLEEEDHLFIFRLLCNCLYHDAEVFM